MAVRAESKIIGYINNEESVMAVHKEVIVYYTKQMKKAASQNVYSKHILMFKVALPHRRIEFQFRFIW